ncbi:MAG: hypothetical protein ACSHYA_14320 [Opitutaceae bacterium]
MEKRDDGKWWLKTNKDTGKDDIDQLSINTQFDFVGSENSPERREEFGRMISEIGKTDVGHDLLVNIGPDSSSARKQRQSVRVNLKKGGTTSAKNMNLEINVQDFEILDSYITGFVDAAGNNSPLQQSLSDTPIFGGKFTGAELLFHELTHVSDSIDIYNGIDPMTGTKSQVGSTRMTMRHFGSFGDDVYTESPDILFKSPAEKRALNQTNKFRKQNGSNAPMRSVYRGLFSDGNGGWKSYSTQADFLGLRGN